MELRTPVLDQSEWKPGKQLGEGLDKEVFNALYRPGKGRWKGTDYVIKRQKATMQEELIPYRDGQTRLELNCQEECLANIDEDWAKAALPWLAHIVGYYVDPEYGLTLVQEKVTVNTDPWALGPDIWGTPIGMLPDQGGSNCGWHPITKQPVCVDYGLAKPECMKRVGLHALERETR